MDTGCSLQGSCCFCIFVRFPAPGKVKTRLAAGVGPAAACAFYRACASYTIQLVCRHSSAHVAIYYSSGDKEADILEWVASLGLQPTKLRSQSTDPCLGVKIRLALEQELAVPGVTKALVLGSDIPGLTKAVLEAAVDALDTHEVVLGPAVDGGFYLLGTRGPQVEPSLFEGIEWSTSSVLEKVLQKATAAGLRVAPLNTLPVLQDIDTLDDLRAWKDTQGTEEVAAMKSHAAEISSSRDCLLKTVEQVISQT
ncbi:nucleotide-diphospho-sugar transferase [Dunaliella salina]|uniref:Nucleotide-diphospho-sugar transferase n=1 Tax=Dunaliella salina TaxID=3046 RepID=A0ABQ7G6Q2_DUNSA|nr:nucleotide-diphospho-sugar transferase [Dunaliella salina]|eukprot:KAF5830260.1 nucleotide-diphospho-sugar transferase [Dunaliella salina]